MRQCWRYGVGKMEVLAFIVICGVGAMIFLFLQQKPQVVQGPGMVQAPPPPAAAPEPAPVVVNAPAPEPPPKPVVVVAPPPPPPPPSECAILEGKIKTASDALAKADANLSAAKSAAIEKLHGSMEYQSALSDLSDKQEARKAAVTQLAKDNASGSDTDRDQAALRTAAQDIISAKQKVASLEDDATQNDEPIKRAADVVAARSGELKALEKQLSDYISTAVATAAPDTPPDATPSSPGMAQRVALPNCSIDSVVFDPVAFVIEIRLTPQESKSPGMITDAAITRIACILDKALYHAQFTWKTAKFTVFGQLNAKSVPAFQVTYLRDSVGDTLFHMPDGSHYDDQMIMTQAHSVWLSHSICEIQGLPKPQPIIIPAVFGSRPMLKYTVRLAIGGYTRADGSACPVCDLQESWEEEMRPAQQQSPLVRSPNIPLYSGSSPGVLTNHP